MQGYDSQKAAQKAGQKAVAHAPEPALALYDLIEKAVFELADSWDDLKSAPDTHRAQDYVAALWHHAAALKSTAAAAGHELLPLLAGSLQDFCAQIELNNAGHQTIIQTHLDVINIAHHDNITSPDSPEGAELKLSVTRAIARYR